MASAPQKTEAPATERQPICFSLPPHKRRKTFHIGVPIKEPVSRRPSETMSQQIPPEMEKLSDDERPFPAAEALRMYELKRWIETNEQRCTTKLKQILPKIDPSRLNFHDRLLREKILGTEYGRTGSSSQTSQFAIERLEDLKVTFVINVFPSGFSIDNQPQVHGYTKTTKSFVRSIDSTTLTPDLSELLEEIPCHYYDGCIVIELRDYRSQMNGSSQAPPGGFKAPIVRRILLRPEFQTIISDIQLLLNEYQTTSMGGSSSTDLYSEWTNDDLLAVEKRIVFATQPSLCLDASVKVFLVSNLLHYNRSKFNFKRPGVSYFGIWNERVMKKNTQLPLLYNPSIISSHYHLLHQPTQPSNTSAAPTSSSASHTSTTTPTVAPNSSPLFRYLQKKLELGSRPSTPGMLMGQSHVSSSAFLQPALHPVLSIPALPVRTFPALAPLKRSIKFQRSDSTADSTSASTPTAPTASSIPTTSPTTSTQSSKIFVCCDISPRVEGNGAGYVALLREGELPDTSSNGESMSFSLGNYEEAERFLLQFIRLMEKESFLMIHDSAYPLLMRRPSAPQPKISKSRGPSVAPTLPVAAVPQPSEAQIRNIRSSAPARGGAPMPSTALVPPTQQTGVPIYRARVVSASVASTTQPIQPQQAQPSTQTSQTQPNSNLEGAPRRARGK